MSFIQTLENVYHAPVYNELMHRVCCSSTVETILYFIYKEPDVLEIEKEMIDYIKHLATNQKIPLTLDNIGRGDESIRDISFEVGISILEKYGKNRSTKRIKYSF